MNPAKIRATSFGIVGSIIRRQKMTNTSNFRIKPLAMALGTLFALSFVLCVIFGLLFSGATMYQAWLPLLPGVSWISWPSFALGLVESFAYGWFIAAIFVPAFNYFSRQATA
jgi:uncharacterized protein DUF5676